MRALKECLERAEFLELKYRRGKLLIFKLGFDIRSLSPPDPKTGYRGVRRIEVKGRRKGENIRLTVKIFESFSIP